MKIQNKYVMRAICFGMDEHRKTKLPHHQDLRGPYWTKDGTWKTPKLNLWRGVSRPLVLVLVIGCWVGVSTHDNECQECQTWHSNLESDLRTNIFPNGHMQKRNHSQQLLK
jgi:adenosyl cobinamide kinase/adenosyl cobinamide phosphate guanylyltransferase